MKPLTNSFIDSLRIDANRLDPESMGLSDEWLREHPAQPRPAVDGDRIAQVIQAIIMVAVIAYAAILVATVNAQLDDEISKMQRDCHRAARQLRGIVKVSCE